MKSSMAISRKFTSIKKKEGCNNYVFLLRFDDAKQIRK